MSRVDNLSVTGRTVGLSPKAKRGRASRATAHWRSINLTNLQMLSNSKYRVPHRQIDTNSSQSTPELGGLVALPATTGGAIQTDVPDQRPSPQPSPEGRGSNSQFSEAVLLPLPSGEGWGEGWFFHITLNRTRLRDQ